MTQQAKRDKARRDKFWRWAWSPAGLAEYTGKKPSPFLVQFRAKYRVRIVITPRRSKP